MEFEDIHDKVYGTFRDEFLAQAHKDANGDRCWYNFIQNKDLGVQYIVKPGFDAYGVIDEKKWLFARLKYGI